MRVCIYILFLGFIPLVVHAQDLSTAKNRRLRSSSENVAQSYQKAPQDYIILQDIIIEGNKKTQERIILRELDIGPGDTLKRSEVDTILLINKNKIFNTNLFVTVDLALESVHSLEKNEQARLKIKLQERWYFFPGPIFELSDRNFNEWIRTYGADFSRTNYGARFVLENFRGRGEKLDLLVQFGFTQNFSLIYKIPYINRNQKLGLDFDLSYSQNKSVAYRTSDHQLDFVDSDEILRERLRVRVGLNRRSAFYQFHNFELNYEDNYVADTVIALNTRYFLGQRNRQRFLGFKYVFTKDLRDISYYPLRGGFLQFTFEKKGLGIFNGLNSTVLSGRFARFYELTNNLFLDHTFEGEVTFQSSQPYTDSQGIGYGDAVLRGFELYVIDGQAYALNKNTLKFRLFQVKKNFKFIPIQQFRTVPLAAYLTLFLDTGYVRDRFFTETSNRFSNRFIYGWGAGVNLVTFYNLIFRLNYSINSDLEKGVFIKLGSNF